MQGGEVNGGAQEGHAPWQVQVAGDLGGLDERLQPNLQGRGQAVAGMWLTAAVQEGHVAHSSGAGGGTWLTAAVQGGHGYSSGVGGAWVR